MARPKLGYDVEVGYEGEQAVRRAIGDLEKFYTELDQVERAANEVSDASGGMFSGAAKSWTEFRSAIDVVSGGLQQAQQIAQEAWETINRGADLERTTQQAEALAQSIGENWEVLLSRMTDATGGMISQADLATSAVDLIGLGMASTGDEVTRLSRLVGELGWDMQTLTLTLANQSTARLDSLGLSMEDVTGKAKELRDAGLSADEAFQLAVIEAGEEKLKLLGSAAETTAGDLQKLETAWNNIQDSFAKRAAEATAEPLGNLADWLQESDKVMNALEQGIITAEEYNRVIAETGTRNVFNEGEALEKLTVLVDARSEQLAIAAQKEKDYYIELGKGADTVDHLFDKYQKLNTESIELFSEDDIQRAHEFHDALYAQSDALTASADAANEAAAAHESFARDAAAAWAEYTSQIQAAGGDAFTDAAFDPEQTYKAEEAIYKHIDAVGADAQALSELAVKLGLVDQEQADYGVTIAQQEAVLSSLDESLKAGAISVEQYVTAYEEAMRRVSETTTTAAPELDITNAIDRAEKKFIDSGAGIGGSFTTAIETAVSDAEIAIGDFKSDEELFNTIMDMDITAIEDGVIEANDLLDTVKDKQVTISFATSGYEDVKEKYDELGG